jgi:hypothetical protein
MQLYKGKSWDGKFMIKKMKNIPQDGENRKAEKFLNKFSG